MPRSTILIFTALLALIRIAAAQSVPLEWRWNDGDQNRYRITERMHQTVSGPASAELIWTREIGFTDRVLTSRDDKATIERTFGWIDVSVERDGQPPARHDTRDPAAEPDKADPLLIAPFIALAGKSIVFTVDADGKVSDLKGSEETLDAMLGPLATDGLAAGLGAFSKQPGRERRLSRQLEQALRVIPGRMVRRGERWPVEIDHTTPLAGEFSSDLTATLKRWNRRDQTAEIELEGSLIRGDPAEGGLPDLLPITLESGSITGTIRFDTEQGRIAESEIEMRTAFLVGVSLTPDAEPMRQTLIQKATLERLEDGKPTRRGRRP